MTREQELEKAIDKAALPPRDYRIYRALFKRAEWKTGVIPAKFQPRGVDDVAKLAGLSPATAKRSLNHLESHGWIERKRKPKGRGYTTVYQLLIGMDCDCLKVRGEPKSDAERARRYRERQREVAQHPVTRPAGSGSDSRDEVAQIDVTKWLTSRDESAGQPRFSAKEGRDEGNGERDMKNWPDPDETWVASRTFPESWSSWPEGTIGEQVNRSTDTSNRRAA